MYFEEYQLCVRRCSVGGQGHEGGVHDVEEEVVELESGCGEWSLAVGRRPQGGDADTAVEQCDLSDGDHASDSVFGGCR